MRDPIERVLWISLAIAFAAVIFLLLEGCASPHFMAGDALICEKGGEYREDGNGVVVVCEQGLRWTGPMSDNAANASLDVLKGALDAIP